MNFNFGNKDNDKKNAQNNQFLNQNAGQQGTIFGQSASQNSQFPPQSTPQQGYVFGQSGNQGLSQNNPFVNQNDVQQCSVFGQPNNQNVAFGAQNTGQQGSVFAQLNNQNPNVFSAQCTPQQISISGQANNQGINPFEQQQPTTSLGQHQFSSAPQSGITPSDQLQSTNNVFSQTASPFGNTDFLSKKDVEVVAQPPINEGNKEQDKTFFFGSTSRVTDADSNTSFVQMTLYKIIQQQVSKLEKNISNFEKKAEEIFMQDKALNKAISRYKILKEKLDKEEKEIAELEKDADFFEELLDNFIKNIPKSEDDDDLVTCMKEYERISDAYYKSIEEIKDADDVIFSLVKENYNLCSIIDQKMDLYEKYR